MTAWTETSCASSAGGVAVTPHQWERGRTILLRYRREGGVADQEQERPANLRGILVAGFATIWQRSVAGLSAGNRPRHDLVSYEFVSRRVANQLQDLAGSVNCIGAVPGVADRPRNGALECS